MMRKRLDHKTHFAGRFGAIYFITICCQQRGFNHLCNDETAAVLANTTHIYHERGRWNLDLLLLMPDHLHALIGVDGQTSLSQLIRDYKRITAKIAGVKWQRNFFDHRLRHDESWPKSSPTFVRTPSGPGYVVLNTIGLIPSSQIGNPAGSGDYP
jgi:putative transposase